MRLEKDVEKRIKQMFEEQGWEVRNIEAKAGTKAGVSDLILAKNGIVKFVEVKSTSAFKKTNYDLSDLQIDFLKKFGNGFVATIDEKGSYVEVRIR